MALEHSEAGVPETDTSHPLTAGAPVSALAPTFAELGVKPEIVRALGEAGIERTLAIQELTLPLALADTLADTLTFAWRLPAALAAPLNVSPKQAVS